MLSILQNSCVLLLFSHMACEEGRAEIAVTLVENGANLYIQNKVSQGPYIQYNSSLLSEKIKGCLTTWHAVQETDYLYMTNNKTSKQSIRARKEQNSKLLKNCSGAYLEANTLIR